MSAYWQRLLASRPVNRTAATVTSGGEHFTPEVKGDRTIYYARPKLRERDLPPELSAFIGKRVGRMVVHGILFERHRKAKARWVCKCPCGNYECRSLAAIAKNANPDAMCGECEAVERLKRKGSSFHKKAMKGCAA